MPIVDTVSSGQITGSAGGMATWTHTVGSWGSNRALYVSTASNMVTSLNPDVGSVTCNGIALTRIAGPIQNTFNNREIDLWRLLNPPAGTVTIVATSNASTSGLACAAISLYNVNPITPEGTPQTAGAGTGTATNSTTTTTGGSSTDLNISITNHRGTDTPTAGASQTIQIANTPAFNINTAISTQPGASSVTDTWAWIPNDSYGEISIAVVDGIAQAAAPTVAGFSGILGMGIQGTAIQGYNVQQTGPIAQALTAALTFAGSIVKQTSYPLAASLTLTGSLAKNVSRRS